MNAQGKTVTISAAGYQATIAELGANLCSLSYGGRNLILPAPAEKMRPAARGAMLLPWPNRIDGGNYSFEGVQYQLPLTEPEKNNASHGLVSWLPWELGQIQRGQNQETVTASLKLFPSPGYPFSLHCQITFSVGARGLEVDVATANSGTSSAPYAYGAHPYLIAEDKDGATGAIDRWQLKLGAESYLETNERLIPLAKKPVAASRLDFRSSKPLAGIDLDHGYGDLSGRERWVDLTLAKGPQAGSGVRLSYDTAIRWLQVYTDGAQRAGVAIEPMTAPANAFRTGTDLIRLEAGQTHRLRWGIQAL